MIAFIIFYFLYVKINGVRLKKSVHTFGKTVISDYCHSFEIEETTQFLFIRFNNIYIKNSALQPDNV